MPDEVTRIIAEKSKVPLQGCRVVHFANPDTILDILLHELLGLQEGGVQVSVLTGSSSRVEAVRGRGFYVKTISFTRKMAPLRDLLTLFQVVSYLRKAKPVILHNHNPKPTWIGTLAGTIARVPVIINTVHGRYGAQGKPRPTRWMMTLLDRLEVRLANRTLAVSQEDAVSLLDFAGSMHQKVVDLGGGVILDQYNPHSFTPAVVSRIRHELGIPSGNLVIGTVGRLVREKGYLELFQAVQMLRRDTPNVTLLVVGREDPEKDDAVTQEMVDQLGIGENVIFAGPSATPALYAAMDIFALASHREGLPRTPMEAAAMAKPLVVTDIRGCRQIVDNGLNGFLVPVKDAPSLAQALAQLLENETLRRRLGQAARQKAVVQFDYRSTVRTMLKVYQEALQQGHPKTSPSALRG